MPAPMIMAVRKLNITIWDGCSLNIGFRLFYLKAFYKIFERRPVIYGYIRKALSVKSYFVFPQGVHKPAVRNSDILTGVGNP